MLSRQPGNTGIGGDVFALFWDEKAKRVRALNGSGRAPKGLTLERVRASGIKGSNIPVRHIHSSTVPGSAAAWCDMAEHFGNGKLSLAELLEPAITIAEEGFPVSEISSGLVRRDHQQPI